MKKDKNAWRRCIKCNRPMKIISRGFGTDRVYNAECRNSKCSRKGDWQEARKPGQWGVTHV